jgi:hypothetical protein
MARGSGINRHDWQAVRSGANSSRAEEAARASPIWQPSSSRDTQPRYLKCGDPSHRRASGQPRTVRELIRQAYIDAIEEEPSIGTAFRADITATVDRDPPPTPFP